jgi:hypothetical protein
MVVHVTGTERKAQIRPIPLQYLNNRAHLSPTFCIVRMSSLLEKLTLEKEEAVSELNAIIVTGLFTKVCDLLLSCIAHGLKMPHL